MRMQARDVMGILLLLLVAVEVSRKYMFIQGMSETQAAVQVTSKDIHAHQFVQHMLIPPTDPRIQNPICKFLINSPVPAQLNSFFSSCPPGASLQDLMNHTAVREYVSNARIQKVCESPGEKCLPGEEVRCLTGSHVGCHCDHIRLCFPHASHCTVYNSTHSLSCGF